MKKILGAIVLALFLCAVFFIAFPGPPAAHKEQIVTISPDNPFLASKPVPFPFDKDHLAYGDELLHNHRYEEALAVFSNIYANDSGEGNKAAALIAACDTLTRKNDSDSPRFARELCEQYLQRFPKAADAAAAHFYLGYLLAEQKDLSGALAHFTTVAADFPDSGLARTAAFNAKSLAGVLQQQDDSQKARFLRIAGPLIPRNPTALIALFGYAVSILGWLAYDWERMRKKLVEDKHPLAWIVLILSIGLIAINYTREWRANSSLMDLPGILAKLRQ